MKQAEQIGDFLISGTAADGCLRIIGAETTAAVNRAQSIHHTAPTAAGRPGAACLRERS